MADKHEWEDWDEEKRKRAKEAIALFDGIKLYRSAGGIGVGTKHAGASAELARRGGTSPGDALALSRYKMFREATGDDPNWQGPLNINVGEREDQGDPDKRRDAYFAADSKERKRMIDAESAAVGRSRERFYDDLVQPHRVSDAEALSQSVKRKRKG